MGKPMILTFPEVEVHQPYIYQPPEQQLDRLFNEIEQWYGKIEKLNFAKLAVSDSVEMLRYETFALPIEEKIQFTALIVEVLATLEAALEPAKTDDLKPETIAAIDGIMLQLFRNPGVREYWHQAIYAEDFMAHADQICKKAQIIPPNEPGNLPFFLSQDDLSQ